MSLESELKGRISKLEMKCKGYKRNYKPYIGGKLKDYNRKDKIT